MFRALAMAAGIARRGIDVRAFIGPGPKNNIQRGRILKEHSCSVGGIEV